MLHNSMFLTYCFDDDSIYYSEWSVRFYSEDTPIAVDIRTGRATMLVYGDI